MKIIKFISYVYVLILVTSCDQTRLNFDRGIIPVQCINFDQVNSIHDDYNSSGIWTENDQIFKLYFSTNRNTSGESFDFTKYNCLLYFNLITGEFDILANQEDPILMSNINSPKNELGPFFEYDEMEGLTENESISGNKLYYSSDISGNLDIFYQIIPKEYNYESPPDENPMPLENLNTEFNEAYLCLYKNEKFNYEFAWFCSDREGDYDLYYAKSENLKSIAETEAPQIIKDTLLNSNSEDKCPFIYEDVMVFASNRAGGYGGYDLYYSVFSGTTWSEAVNFGSSINTVYDEYRPFVIRMDENSFVNNLMIFSSNRPGGKGGFDLYYTGIKSLNTDN